MIEGAMRGGVLAVVVALALVTFACEPAPSRARVYGDAGVVSDGAEGTIWVAPVALHAGESVAGVLSVSGSRVRIDRSRSGASRHRSIASTRLLLAEDDTFLWLSPSATASGDHEFIAALWHRDRGFSGERILKLPGSRVDWTCRVAPEAPRSTAIYAIGGRRKDSTGASEFWVELVDFELSEHASGTAAQPSSSVLEFTALFAAHDVWVGMTTFAGAPVHAFLFIDADTDEVRLLRAHNGALDELPVAPALASFVMEHHRAGAFLVPLLGASDTPLVLAGTRNASFRLELTAHTDEPVDGRAQLSNSYSFSYAAAVGSNGRPIAIVAGTMDGGRTALAVRESGIHAFEVLPDELFDPLGADWGERLALANVGAPGAPFELSSVRTGDSSGRSRIWRHRVVFEPEPRAWVLETIDSSGRWRAPGPDQR